VIIVYGADIRWELFDAIKRKAKTFRPENISLKKLTAIQTRLMNERNIDLTSVHCFPGSRILLTQSFFFSLPDTSDPFASRCEYAMRTCDGCKLIRCDVTPVRRDANAIATRHVSDSMRRDHGTMLSRCDTTSHRRRQAALIEELSKKPMAPAAPAWQAPTAPPASAKRPRDDGQDGHFRRDACPPPASACVLCLGCASLHPDGLPKCRPDRLWDNSAPTYFIRDDRGNLVYRSNGRTPICFVYNRGGCASKAHPERHLCSGCGSA
jgi:hypothetical protein